MSYFLHFIRSKRRHGVHSPFVYAYADNVLHRYPLWNYPISSKARNQVSNAILSQTIDFLSEKRNPSTQSVRPDLLIDATFIVLNEIFPIVLDNNHIYIVPHLHQKSRRTQWNQWTNNHNFKLAIDAFYIGIATSHSAFKQNEFFLLK